MGRSDDLDPDNKAHIKTIYTTQEVLILITDTVLLFFSHHVWNQLYDNTDDKANSFYSDLEKNIRPKKGKVTMAIRDFNSKSVNGIDGKTIGRYGLNARNAKGDRSVKFCVEN